MLWKSCRGSILPLKGLHVVGPSKTIIKKSRYALPAAFLPTEFFDAIIDVGPPLVDATEAVRAQAIVNSTDAWYMLHLTFYLSCLAPMTIFLHNIGLLTLFRRRKTRIAKNPASCRSLLYGVDTTSSQVLKRPLVEAAVHFAAKAHHEQKRKTGDPYITHCIHTALIVENILQPTMPDDRCETAVICALLHDVLDDTAITKDDLQNEFGQKIATAVLEISELSSSFQLLRRYRRQQEKDADGDEDRNAEDRKLRTAIIKRLEDPVILAVKLADRLHNLRTIHVLSPAKQRAVALETQSILCTLAERLGLFSLKAEMEDLCFCILQPDEFWRIYQQVQLMWKSENAMRQNSTEFSIDSVQDASAERTVSRRSCKELLQLVTPFTSSRCTHHDLGLEAGLGLDFLHKRGKELLMEISMLSFTAGLDVSVVGRVKSLYSTYQKMQKKNINVDEVYDVLALRVIVTEDGDAEIAREVCYRTLSVVQQLWKQIPAEFDDYIVEPKESGYQSLHVSVKGPGKVPFEVQIRTASMDARAEYGHAAHWKYKEAIESSASGVESLTLRDAIWGENKSIVGRPVVRIRDGCWRDGIVVAMENSGLAIIVAVSISNRISHSYGSYTFAVRQYYEKLLKYVEERKWFSPRIGDLNVVVERYVLCSDRAYHLFDIYGHKHPTIVRPVSVFESDTSLASHVQSLNTGVQQNALELDEEDREIKDRVTQLRSMLEYHHDVHV